MTGELDGRSIPKLDPAVALQIARAAFRNAQEYMAEARSLQRQGKYGRASAMAIIGREEVGKALYLFLVACGVMELKRDTLRMLFRSHEWKQTLGLVLAAVPSIAVSLRDEPVVAAITSTLAEAVAESAPQRRTELVMEQLPGIFSSITRQMETHATAAAGFFQERQELFEGMGLQSSQDAKHRGLYVDYIQSTDVVTSPADVGRRAARRSLAELRSALHVTQRMVMTAEVSEANIGMVNVHLSTALAESRARTSR